MAEKLTNEQIIDTLKQMSALELSNLVKEVEKEFGVTAAAPVAAAAAPAEEDEGAKKGTKRIAVEDGKLTFIDNISGMTSYWITKSCVVTCDDFHF